MRLGQEQSTSRLANREECKAPITVQRQDDKIELSFFPVSERQKQKQKQTVVEF